VNDRVFTATIRLESEAGELELTEALTEAIWKGLTPLVNDGHIDEVSHVDVEETGEEGVDE